MIILIIYLGAVTIIAILSDILHDNQINKFDELFMALNQVI